MKLLLKFTLKKFTCIRGGKSPRNVKSFFLLKHITKKEEQVIAQAASEIKNIKREQEGKAINLRHENATLHMNVNELNEKIVCIVPAHAMILKLTFLYAIE